jgi:hypothetical protein
MKIRNPPLRGAERKGRFFNLPLGFKGCQFYPISLVYINLVLGFNFLLHPFTSAIIGKYVNSIMEE